MAMSGRRSVLAKKKEEQIQEAKKIKLLAAITSLATSLDKLCETTLKETNVPEARIMALRNIELRDEKDPTKKRIMSLIDNLRDEYESYSEPEIEKILQDNQLPLSIYYTGSCSDLPKPKAELSEEELQQREQEKIIDSEAREGFGLTHIQINETLTEDAFKLLLKKESQRKAMKAFELKHTKGKNPAPKPAIPTKLDDFIRDKINARNLQRMQFRFSAMNEQETKDFIDQVSFQLRLCSRDLTDENKLSEARDLSDPGETALRYRTSQTSSLSLSLDSLPPPNPSPSHNFLLPLTASFSSIALSQNSFSPSPLSFQPSPFSPSPTPSPKSGELDLTEGSSPLAMLPSPASSSFEINGKDEKQVDSDESSSSPKSKRFKPISGDLSNSQEETKATIASTTLSINATKIILDLTAVNSYAEEIKKSDYKDDLLKQHQLTSKIIENITIYLRKNVDGITAFTFSGLDAHTKNQLALILNDHATNAARFAKQLPDAITEQEIEAYHDMAIGLCATKDAAKDFHLKKQANLEYFKRQNAAKTEEESKMSVASNGSGSKKKSSSKITPAQLQLKLFFRTEPSYSKLTQTIFPDGDSHLAAIARARFDDEGYIIGSMEILLKKIDNESEFYDYITAPIHNESLYNGHCIISLAAMNPNQFLDILLKKIAHTSSINKNFNAYSVMKKLAAYKVPHGKDKGESLFTLAIKYGDVTHNYDKLDEAYKRTYTTTDIHAKGKKQITEHKLDYKKATDCKGSTPLEVAEASYFNTVKTLGYYSLQATNTFKILYHLSGEDNDIQFSRKLDLKLKEMGIEIEKRGTKQGTKRKRKTDEPESSINKDSASDKEVKVEPAKTPASELKKATEEKKKEKKSESQPAPFQSLARPVALASTARALAALAPSAKRESDAVMVDAPSRSPTPSNSLANGKVKFSSFSIDKPKPPTQSRSAIDNPPTVSKNYGRKI